MCSHDRTRLFYTAHILILMAFAESTHFAPCNLIVRTAGWQRKQQLIWQLNTSMVTPKWWQDSVPGLKCWGWDVTELKWNDGQRGCYPTSALSGCECLSDWDVNAQKRAHFSGSEKQWLRKPIPFETQKFLLMLTFSYSKTKYSNWKKKKNTSQVIQNPLSKSAYNQTS